MPWAAHGRECIGHSRNCQTPPASPAKPGGLPATLDRADVQDAIRDRILSGDTGAFFKAVEHVIGKPRQAVELNQDAEVVFRWQD